MSIKKAKKFIKEMQNDETLWHSHRLFSGKDKEKQQRKVKEFPVEEFKDAIQQKLDNIFDQLSKKAN